MSRISKRFQQLRQQHRKALVPYVTAGDSEPTLTVPLMHRMVAAGADFIELGVPFSDPMADGPVIQLACERALAHNTSLTDVLVMVEQFRLDDQQTPVILMGYLNPIEVMGYQPFAKAAQQVGVDGVLIVDLPPEEGREVIPLFQQHELDPIFLLAPTTKRKRMAKICDNASGFVYYVSLKGVTGASSLDTHAVAQVVAKIRQATDLPIAVGFGVKDARTAAQIADFADAVVVGSALVKQIAKNVGDNAKIMDDISHLLTSMREAMDSNLIVNNAS